MESSLIVYKASAGSGKTFTLALQYIKTLIGQEGRHNYSHILAVTFTNKATAEMKDRILQQLYGIWKRLPSSDDYVAALRRELEADGVRLTDEEISRRAGQSLCHILHDYNRFRVETIDSFFQSVMKNLAHELSLTANLKVDLNDKEVLNAAVDRIMDRLNLMPKVMDWILEYVDDRLTNNERWDIAREVKAFASWIFKEAYLTHEEELRKALKDDNRIRELRKALEGERKEAQDIVESAVEHFREELERWNARLDDFKFGSNIDTYLRRMEEGNLDPDFKARMQGFVDNADNWLKKSDAGNAALREAAGHFCTLLGELRRFQLDCLVRHNSATLALKHLNPLRLLGTIDEEVTALNHENNRFLLAKTPILLHELIEDSDAPFVFEKMGAYFHHVMIDEFQDTSAMQWKNFKILLLESMASGYGNLIVGDVKQSIYRWRNGDWSILNNLRGKMEGIYPIREMKLTTNRRSESNIIRFNNEFFTAACQTLNRRYQEEQGMPCTQLEQAYSDVRQRCAKKDEKGFVKVTFLQDSKERPYTEATLQQLAEEVERLTAEGIRLNEMAILVRKNRSIPDIAAYFDEHTPYRIVSDEAFQLNASLAVNMLIDGLRYLSSPDDRIALARLAVAYQQEVLRKDISLNTVLLDDPKNYLPAAFRLQANELRFMPLYELLEKLFVLFDMERIEQQDAYLYAFYDAVTEYMQNNSSELTAFIRFWDEKLNTKTIPSGEIDGIRILSIHKSKGLEYHTVLLPFCDWKMENETNNHLIWCSVAGTGKETDIPPFNRLDIVPVNYSSAMAESVYHDDYLEEKLQLWVDNLNLLYVAFTRACKNLIIFAKAGQKGTVSELLYDSLPLMQEVELPLAQEDPEDDAVGEYGELCTAHDEKKAGKSNRLSSPKEGVPVKMESIETHIEFKQSNRSADFIQGDEADDSRGQYIRQGQLLHQVFAHIEKADDLSPALERLNFEGIFESEKQMKQVEALARRALQHPAAKDWFSGTWELYNECAIVYTDEEGQMQTRRPDRVMRKDGQVVVVDFKFGKKNEAYRTQVQDYMNLLTQMGYTHIRGFLWYVFANELEEVTLPA